MDNHQRQEHDTLVQSLWTTIFQGTRLRHVGTDKDPRIFVLKSIDWRRQESKVTDVDTGETSRFPWNELEFIDPIEGNLPGWLRGPKTL
jgi:hypothetical protein